LFVVIFSARIKHLDDAYLKTAARMRDLALSEFGCLSFRSVTEGDTEIALSYWPSEQHIRAWNNHPEHRAAQQAGRKHWYESYSVQVAEVTRAYES
tara:strand:- start:113488 stop:113775 length:288 start_codon:yes stop_codon:yes gene_type:complete